MARTALRVLQTGLVAAVVVALPYAVFDLDRFLLPKELALHLTAVIGAIFAFGVMRRLTATRVDLLLALYVLLGAIAALLATNRWLALRAVALSASGVVIFWIARGAASAGLERRVVNGVALAVVLAAAMALLQAYGIRTDFFAMSRAPGGTLGNRNFVAHVAALGLPACMLVATESAIALPGIAIVSAALVLTRSRAAWLACAALLLFSWPLIKRRPLIVVAAAAGVVAALFVPNALHWRSDNPYLQSVQGVANYEEGSGRGRLVQYSHSLQMTLFHPLLGVGPGNWPVVYPRYAAHNDPSMSPSDPGMTYNPWPSSDWTAFVSERGPIAALVLLFAFWSAATGRRLPDGAEDEDVRRRQAAALRAMLAAVIVEGLFDAVLLLALPTMLFFAILGALIAPREAAKPVTPYLLGVLVIALAGAAYSAAELFSMQALVSGRRDALERAAQIDPGNYRVQLRLGRGGKHRCEHADAAHALFPTSVEAARLSRGCR